MTQLPNSYSLLDNTGTDQAQLKLLQALSQPVIDGKGEPGKIFNTLTETNYDSIEILIFGVREEFRVWKDKEGLSKFPEYASDDMQTLIHFDPDTGEKLGEEPLPESPKWINRKENKNARLQYCFLATLLDKPQPLLFRVGGLGFKHARRFLNRAKSSEKQLYQFVTRIKGCGEKTKYGSTFVPEFQITDLPLPEWWNVEKVAKVCQHFIDNTKALPAGNQ